MTSDQVAIFAILTALVALLVWGRWRYDVGAFASLMAAVAAGLVKPAEAFLGFGHPATVTVAAMLVLSHALASASAVDRLIRRPRWDGPSRDRTEAPTPSPDRATPFNERRGAPPWP